MILVLNFPAKRQTTRAHDIGQTSTSASWLKEAVRYILQGL